MLIVDDEKYILLALNKYFTKLGFEVDCAQDLVIAKSKLNEDSFNIVICDLCLQGAHNLTGFELIKFINEKNRDIAIIVLSAFGSAEIELEARRLGAAAFVHKPTPLSDLAQVIFEALASAQLVKE